MTATATTQAEYGRLISIHKAGQDDIGNPLLRFMQLDGDQLHELALIIRADWTDPSTCDPAWLDWLGQFIGARWANGETVTQKRADLTSPARLSHGTVPAIIAKLCAAYPAINPAHVVVSTQHLGNRWLITVATFESELPASPTKTTTFAELFTACPTFVDFKLACPVHDWRVSITAVEATAVVFDEKPAGSRIAVLPYPDVVPEFDPVVGHLFSVFLPFPGAGTGTVH